MNPSLLTTCLLIAASFLIGALAQYWLTRQRRPRLARRDGYCIVTRANGKQHYRKLPTQKEQKQQLELQEVSDG